MSRACHQIGNVMNFRFFGINMLAEEGAGWFPGEELKEHYGLGDYQDSKLEGLLLGHKSDGREGILCSTIPPYVKANGSDGKGGALKANNSGNSEEDDEEAGICMVQVTTTTANNSEKH